MLRNSFWLSTLNFEKILAKCCMAKFCSSPSMLDFFFCSTHVLWKG